MERVPPAALTPTSPGIWLLREGSRQMAKGREEEEVVLGGNLRFHCVCQVCLGGPSGRMSASWDRGDKDGGVLTPLPLQGSCTSVA